MTAHQLRMLAYLVDSVALDYTFPDLLLLTTSIFGSRCNCEGSGYLLIATSVVRDQHNCSEIVLNTRVDNLRENTTRPVSLAERKIGQ